MKKLEFSIKSIDELPGAATEILRFAGDRKVFAIHGEMGAGKTTLIKELCRQLGSNDSFSSPTYSIVNEYLGTGANQRMYHIDLYRIKNVEEALALGIEDYISGEHYCFIEWPELIASLLPENVLQLHIKLRNNTREFAIFV